jgi:hypothetical protein
VRARERVVSLCLLLSPLLSPAFSPLLDGHKSR